MKSTTKTKKIIVVGAAGLLGTHICEILHEAGYQVHATVRESSSRQWLDHQWLKIHVTELFDTKKLSQIFQGMDVVIHNAGATSCYSFEDYYRINVEGSRCVAQAAVEAKVKRLVFISSLAAAGPSNGVVPRTEDDPDGQPVTSYGKTKKLAEEMFDSYKDDIQIIKLRFPVIYGPRCKRMLSMFKLLQGSIQPLLGLRPSYLSMVHVEDAARAILAASTAEVESGSFYYICDGISYSDVYFYDLVNEALEHRGFQFRIPLWIASFLAWWHQNIMRSKSSFYGDKIAELRARFWLVSPQKAMRDLKWKPEIMPEKGVKETLRWYRYKRWL